MKYLVGIQPTGKIHIGNYLGCLKRGLELQEEGHEVVFMLANYHAMTTDSYTDRTQEELQRLGCKNIIQQTPEYTEFFFKICCQLNLGRLQKMPQFKEKSQDAKFDLGILLYPALMAADIIINDPDVVLVGTDQIPHMHLTNEIAKRMGGRTYKSEFGTKQIVYGLRNSVKMSKSQGEHNVLYLFDEDYQAKLNKAITDVEGLANLRLIAQGIGLDPFQYEMNSDLKRAMATQMQSTFG